MKKYGLERKHYKRHARWAVDCLNSKFLARLPEDQRDWFRRFLKEYYDDQFFSKNPADHIHSKTKLLPESEWRWNRRQFKYRPTTQKQDCTNRKNTRNERDDFAYHRLGKQHVPLEKAAHLTHDNNHDPEQGLIDQIRLNTLERHYKSLPDRPTPTEAKARFEAARKALPEPKSK